MPFQNVQPITLDAATSAAIRQRRFVATSATGIVEAGAGADAVGVSMQAFDDAAYPANASRAISVATNIGCIVEVEAGAAVVAGAKVASDAQGRAATAATGNVIMGTALTAAGAAGEVIDVLLSKQGAASA